MLLLGHTVSCVQKVSCNKVKHKTIYLRLPEEDTLPVVIYS